MELIFWGFIIYIIFKGVGLFLRFFIPAMRDPDAPAARPKKPIESKYKDAQEVDYTEIKSDSDNKKS